MGLEAFVSRDERRNLVSGKGGWDIGGGCGGGGWRAGGCVCTRAYVLILITYESIYVSLYKEDF